MNSLSKRDDKNNTKHLCVGEHTGTDFTAFFIELAMLMNIVDSLIY